MTREMYVAEPPTAHHRAGINIVHPQLRDLIACHTRPGLVTYTSGEAIWEHDFDAGATRRVTPLPFSPNTLTASSQHSLLATGGHKAEFSLSSFAPNQKPWTYSYHLAHPATINNSVLLGSSRTGTPRLVLSNNDHTVRFFDIVVGQGVRDAGRVRLDTAVNHSSISPDGATLLAAGDTPYVHLWNISPSLGTFERIASYRTTSPSQPFAHPHHSAIFSTAFSPSGRQFAVGSQDGTVNLWDVRSSKVLGIYRTLPRPRRIRRSALPGITRGGSSMGGGYSLGYGINPGVYVDPYGGGGTGGGSGGAYGSPYTFSNVATATVRPRQPPGLEGLMRPRAETVVRPSRGPAEASGSSSGGSARATRQASGSTVRRWVSPPLVEEPQGLDGEDEDERDEEDEGDDPRDPREPRRGSGAGSSRTPLAYASGSGRQQGLRPPPPLPRTVHHPRQQPVLPLGSGGLGRLGAARTPPTSIGATMGSAMGSVMGATAEPEEEMIEVEDDAWKVDCMGAPWGVRKVTFIPESSAGGAGGGERLVFTEHTSKIHIVDTSQCLDSSSAAEEEAHQIIDLSTPSYRTVMAQPSSSSRVREHNHGTQHRRSSSSASASQSRAQASQSRDHERHLSLSTIRTELEQHAESAPPAEEQDEGMGMVVDLPSSLGATLRRASASGRRRSSYTALEDMLTVPAVVDESDEDDHDHTHDHETGMASLAPLRLPVLSSALPSVPSTSMGLGLGRPSPPSTSSLSSSASSISEYDEALLAAWIRLQTQVQVSTDSSAAPVASTSSASTSAQTPTINPRTARYAAAALRSMSSNATSGSGRPRSNTPPSPTPRPRTGSSSSGSPLRGETRSRLSDVHARLNQIRLQLAASSGDPYGSQRLVAAASAATAAGGSGGGGVGGVQVPGTTDEDQRRLNEALSEAVRTLDERMRRLDETRRRLGSRGDASGNGQGTSSDAQPIASTSQAARQQPTTASHVTHAATTSSEEDGDSPTRLSAYMSQRLAMQRHMMRQQAASLGERMMAQVGILPSSNTPMLPGAVGVSGGESSSSRGAESAAMGVDFGPLQAPDTMWGWLRNRRQQEAAAATAQATPSDPSSSSTANPSSASSSSAPALNHSAVIRNASRLETVDLSSPGSQTRTWAIVPASSVDAAASASPIDAPTITFEHTSPTGRSESAPIVGSTAPLPSVNFVPRAASDSTPPVASSSSGGAPVAGSSRPAGSRPAPRRSTRMTLDHPALAGERTTVSPLQMSFTRSPLGMSFASPGAGGPSVAGNAARADIVGMQEGAVASSSSSSSSEPMQASTSTTRLAPPPPPPAASAAADPPASAIRWTINIRTERTPSSSSSDDMPPLVAGPPSANLEYNTPSSHSYPFDLPTSLARTTTTDLPSTNQPSSDFAWPAEPRQLPTASSAIQAAFSFSNFARDFQVLTEGAGSSSDLSSPSFPADLHEAAARMRRRGRGGPRTLRSVMAEGQREDERGERDPDGTDVDVDMEMEVDGEGRADEDEGGVFDRDGGDLLMSPPSSASSPFSMFENGGAAAATTSASGSAAPAIHRPRRRFLTRQFGSGAGEFDFSREPIRDDEELEDVLDDDGDLEMTRERDRSGFIGASGRRTTFTRARFQPTRSLLDDHFADASAGVDLLGFGGNGGGADSPVDITGLSFSECGERLYVGTTRGILQWKVLGKKWFFGDVEDGFR